MLDAATHARIHTPGRTSGKPTIPAARPSGCRPTWHVVAAYPKAERRAHAALHLKGFEPYLPLVTVRWHDRSLHTGPLFPGYLFVRLDLSRPWHPVRYAPGVFNLISVDGTTPSICPEAVVEALQATEHLRATPTPAGALWAPGMPCRLATGPFEGHDAVVTQVTANVAFVAILMFGHLREVSLPAECLVARDNA